VKFKPLIFSLIAILLSLSACKEQVPATLFTKLDEEETGVTFRNLLKEDYPDLNIIFYPYFYNGGGVAVGDLNNDGLQDIFFTGNMVKNRLFINKGDFKFEDVTVQSHLAEKEGWCSGSTMVDINEDGWLDIYICRTAIGNVAFRKNLLFINNHDLTFKESAAEYGLDDPGYSTQASFFDYDRDNDLDMILINQSKPEFSRGQLDYVAQKNKKNDKDFENKLFRNDNGTFVDITDSAGISSNIFTFSLGVSTTDINQDGWPDIYVSNDFKESDYYYINNHDGTFTDKIQETISHTSLYAMGVDVADYNNDLLPDIIVLDMLAEGNEAQKMHMGGDNFTQYNHLFRNGMFPQFLKNSLQKNNGDGTFSEIGQLAGVSNTDWSWSPLFADFDNDGLKDLFITNGYKRDNTDIQFVVYSMDQSMKIEKGGDAVSVNEYISHMPGIHMPNYIYSNAGGDTFQNKIKEWGFDHSTYSHGGAYADLDNDGDVDLITNNTDEFAGIYRNNSETLLKNNYLSIVLKGDPKNSFGIGSKVYAYAGGNQFYLEQNPVRGFQSASDPVLHLGLGTHAKLDSIKIIWPDQKTQKLQDVTVNQQLTLKYKDAAGVAGGTQNDPLLIEQSSGLQFVHQENMENDFMRQFLLPHFFSHNGPYMAKADLNNDALEDVFVSGAKGQPSEILIQKKDGTFSKLSNPAFEKDKTFENQDATFFDADRDGDADLYVSGGGYEFLENDALLQDRLYLNNGKGVFTRSTKSLPDNRSSKKCVRPGDVDGDGDIDLFVGGHVVPGKYPLFASSKIYVNDGKGNFSDATPSLAPDLANAGIINAAEWIDLNNDGLKDLILAGEWTSLKAYINKKTSFEDASAAYFPFACTGWWTSFATGDFDKDGDVDVIAGNYGKNSQLKVTEEHPLRIYYPDIDKNGSVDPVITHYIGAEAFPLIPRDDMVGQVPSLKKKFLDYHNYAKASIKEILSPEQLKDTPVLSAVCLNTIYLENTGRNFAKKELPVEAQYAPIYAMQVLDANGDGHEDIILAGNNIYNRIYLARHDANHAMLFTNDGKGNFVYVPQYISGLQVRGDVRSIVKINNSIIFGVNNSSVKTYDLKSSPK
jgi:enediyne biosynthesis protein E4